eukprot:6188082-Pleurochrysis_carterae.AAC.4
MPCDQKYNYAGWVKYKHTYIAPPLHVLRLQQKRASLPRMLGPSTKGFSRFISSMYFLGSIYSAAQERYNARRGAMDDSAADNDGDAQIRHCMKERLTPVQFV